MIFLYERYKPLEHILSNIPLRVLKQEGFRGEILRQFQDLAAAEEYCKSQHPKYITRLIKVKGVRKKFSAETREKMRQAKLGEKNPNAKGISESHRRKISIARYRLGIRRELHFTWNIPRPLSTRRKISATMRNKPKRRWVLDPEGKEHRILASDPIPTNWIPGRKRGQGKRL